MFHQGNAFGDGSPCERRIQRGRDEVAWSYSPEAVDGETVEEFSNDYVCSRLDKERYEIYANSDMCGEHEGSEQTLRHYLQEFAEEWQYDETFVGTSSDFRSLCGQQLSSPMS